MMRRLARPYAIGGLLAALVGAVGAITLRVVDPVPMIPDALGFSDLALVGFEFLGVTFASVGTLLVIRRPENAVGWLMVLIGASNALAGLTAAVTFSAVADGPAGATTASFAGWLSGLFVMIGVLAIGLGFIFPTGRGHTPGWDRLNRIGLVIFLFMLVVFILFRPGPLQVVPSINNPFGIGPDIRSIFGPQISTLVASLGLVFVPFLVWSIVSRYRMSDRIGRQQLKWFVLALLVSQVGIAIATVGALISDEPPQAGLVVFGFAGALVPVAIGIAILRHRLYDIDRIISRTISYAVVSAIVAGVFAAVVVLLSTALSSLAQSQTIAVAASTLTAFAVFQPVLRRVRRGVDMRFNRARYDADTTAAEFSARLRNEVDIATVARDLDATVQGAVKPASLRLWIREARS